MPLGYYDDCTIKVTDSSGNISSVLMASPFFVYSENDFISPILSEVTRLSVITTETEHLYTFFLTRRV